VQLSKGTSLYGNTSYNVSDIFVSGKLGIRPEHPRCHIEMQFYMVGGSWVVVLSFEFDQNRLSGYRDFWSRNLGSCITLANGL